MLGPKVHHRAHRSDFRLSERRSCFAGHKRNCFFFLLPSVCVPLIYIRVHPSLTCSTSYFLLRITLSIFIPRSDIHRVNETQYAYKIHDDKNNNNQKTKQKSFMYTITCMKQTQLMGTITSPPPPNLRLGAKKKRFQINYINCI